MDEKALLREKVVELSRDLVQLQRELDAVRGMLDTCRKERGEALDKLGACVNAEWTETE